MPAPSPIPATKNSQNKTGLQWLGHYQEAFRALHEIQGLLLDARARHEAADKELPPQTGTATEWDAYHSQRVQQFRRDNLELVRGLETYRGTGRTTRAMKALPFAAVYVWCSEYIADGEQIAKAAGRDDLIVVAPSWLRDGCWRGQVLNGLGKDHACQFTDAEWSAYLDAKSRIRYLYHPERFKGN